MLSYKMLSDIDTTAWRISDLVTSNKGAKSASILCCNECPKIRIGTQAEPLSTPFHPSAFTDGQTRLSLDFHVPKYLESFLNVLDTWAKEQLYENSTRLFKREVSKDEINFMYQSCLKKHSKNGVEYPDTFRCKMNTSGIKPCRVWDFDHNSRKLPENLVHTDLVAMIHVKSFWFSGNQCGLVCEVTDLMLKEQDLSCPF